MATEPNFEINNQSISTRSALLPNNQAVNMTRITYYVGPHGPFVYEAPTAQFTPASAKAAFAAQQAAVRETLS